MPRRVSTVLLIAILHGCQLGTYSPETAGETDADSTRPIAAFAATVDNLTVTVDASDSSGSGGNLTYYWDFNGEGASTGISASYTFSTGGEKSITLIVMESGTQSDPAVRTVSISTGNQNQENEAPVASFSVTANGLMVTADGSASSDADNDPLTYHWTFDGEVLDGSTSPTAEYTFDSAGDKTVSLLVNDGEADSAAAQQTVTVPQPGTDATEALTAIAEAMPSSQCTSCHNTATDSTSIDFGTGSESDIRDGIADYLKDHPGDLDLVKGKPTGAVSHSGGSPLGNEPLKTHWQTLVDSLASDTAGSDSYLIHEGFEDQTVNRVPEDWGVNNHYSEYEGADAQEHSSIIHVVDTIAHTGSKALHVSGIDNSKRYIYQNLENQTEGSERLYIRFYLHSAEYLGNRADQSVNHNHFLAISNGDVYNEQEIRIGEMKGALGVNESVSDALVPKYEYWWGKIETPRIDADTWNCVETAFLNDGEKSELRIWVNSELVTEITEPTDFHSNVSDNWLEGRFGRVNIGWASWGTYDNELYFDDIVVATERIGCID